MRAIGRWIYGVVARGVILFFGLMPVSCHYAVTGPALWNHGSSYAFEAWLTLWVLSIGIAAGAIWLTWQD